MLTLLPVAKRYIANTTIAPIIEKIKLNREPPILSNELAIGEPNNVPTYPPTTAPTIPRIVVKITPPPSGPGIIILAK